MILAGWWFANIAYQKFYINAEKKPFWIGTKEVQVCRVPYYSSNGCYRLNVRLFDDKTARIYFPNGGYKDVFDLECWFALTKDDQSRYIFCRGWDKTNQQWQFLPTWIYY
jgi:hypothetical protein